MFLLITMANFRVNHSNLEEKKEISHNYILIFKFLMNKWFLIMSLLFQTAFFANPIIILLGPPGVGKGTHAAPLSKHLKIPHISTGALFREHLEKKTSLGKKAKTFIQKGELVPDSLVLDMLLERVSKIDCKKGYILDGFPRTVVQAKYFEKKLPSSRELQVIYLSASADLLIQRITGRLSCIHCSLIYHKTFSPPQKENTCDECKNKLYQRNDDTKEVFEKRLKVYYDETNPLIDYYRKKKNLYEIKVEPSQSKKEIFEQIISCFEALV